MIPDNVNSMRPSPLHWSRIYLSVALTTLATLLLELSLTRIFSVVFYYHFAFLAISIALFGLGAGGVFSYVVAGWRGHLFSRLGWLSAVNSLVVVLTVAFVLAKDFTFLQLALVYFVSALPFFLAGTIVSLAISETIQKVDRVYFFDLMGAAAGCLVLVPLGESPGHDRNPGGAAGDHRLVCGAHSGRTAALAEGGCNGPDDLSGWICHGDAFSDRPEVAGRPAQTFRPVGVVVECGCQRAWLGRSVAVRHLPRIDTDPVYRRLAVCSGAGYCLVPAGPGRCRTQRKTFLLTNYVPNDRIYHQCRQREG